MLCRLQTLPWRAALMPLLDALLCFFERLRAACIGGIQPYLQIVSEALRPKEARRAFVLAAGFLCLVSSMTYTGDANAAMSAAGLWTEVKNFFFSEWGLVLGVLFLAVAVFGSFQFGWGWGMTIALAGAFFFLIPGAVATLQNWGKSLA